MEILFSPFGFILIMLSAPVVFFLLIKWGQIHGEYGSFKTYFLIRELQKQPEDVIENWIRKNLKAREQASSRDRSNAMIYESFDSMKDSRICEVRANRRDERTKMIGARLLIEGPKKTLQEFHYDLCYHDPYAS